MMKWLGTIGRRLFGSDISPPRASSMTKGGEPNTFIAMSGFGSTAIFDPALRHFRQGFRVGPPPFEDAEQSRAWFAVGESVIDHVLRGVSRSPYRNHLALRGSALMRKWYGAAARPPGDLDFVVVPASIDAKSDWTKGCLAHLANLFDESPGAGVRFLADRLAIDEIWSYERAPGCRLCVPWIAGSLPPGIAQIDVVFGETLAIAPVESSLALVDGSKVDLLTVTREQAFASKLLWLCTDMEA